MKRSVKLPVGQLEGTLRDKNADKYNIFLILKLTSESCPIIYSRKVVANM